MDQLQTLSHHPPIHRQKGESQVQACAVCKNIKACRHVLWLDQNKTHHGGYYCDACKRRDQRKTEKVEKQRVLSEVVTDSLIYSKLLPQEIEACLLKSWFLLHSTFSVKAQGDEVVDSERLFDISVLLKLVCPDIFLFGSQSFLTHTLSVQTFTHNFLFSSSGSRRLELP